MSTSSLTAGMLAGLAGDSPPDSKDAKAAADSSRAASSDGPTLGDVSAELRFASVNWERKKRAPNANPRRSVDMPLTAEDRFLAVPWDPSEAPPPRARASAPVPEISEDDEKAAEEREAQLSVSAFFNKANW